MGSINTIKISKFGGRPPGKIEASLNKRLLSVKWGEYELQQLFDITGTKSLDSNAIDFTDTGVNFVGRTFENNGIQGKIQRREFEPNEPYTITATVIGNYKYVKYQTEEYYCSQNINKLSPKNIFRKWNKRIAYFMIANIQRFVSLYDGQQGGYKLEDIKQHKIKLPLKNGEIDFDFMESFIAELEAQRIAELSAYLKVSGFDNYELSDEELNALQKFAELGDDNWGTYTVGNLFEKVTTKKLPYKAKELPKQPTNDYVLPCLTSSFQNQGLNYYAPKEGATVISNVISLPSNSDVYRAYYQSREFTVLSDSYAIQWKAAENKPTPNQYLFMVMCINKVTDLPIYSYKNKLGGWNVVKHKEIRLPEKDGKIDFAFMEAFISAIKKLSIKDVVKYSDAKINATKEVVSCE